MHKLWSYCYYYCYFGFLLWNSEPIKERHFYRRFSPSRTLTGELSFWSYWVKLYSSDNNYPSALWTFFQFKCVKHVSVFPICSENKYCGSFSPVIQSKKPEQFIYVGIFPTFLWFVRQWIYVWTTANSWPWWCVLRHSSEAWDIYSFFPAIFTELNKLRRENKVLQVNLNQYLLFRVINWNTRTM